MNEKVNDIYSDPRYIEFAKQIRLHFNLMEDVESMYKRARMAVSMSRQDATLDETDYTFIESMAEDILRIVRDIRICEATIKSQWDET